MENVLNILFCICHEHIQKMNWNGERADIKLTDMTSA
jgi:hypothetical protein